MADTTKIDERQSATWAQEITLKALLAESASSNSILESFLKVSGKLSAEQIAELEKSRTEAKKSADDASKSFGKIKPNIDMTLKSAFGDLASELRVSVDTIKSGFKSGDVGSVMSGFSSQAKAAGISMMEWGKAQPVAMRNLSMFAGGLALYAGVAMAMWGTMTQLNAEFNKLYDTGINLTGGLRGMANYAGELGISVSDLTGIMTKYSQAVVYLGTDKTQKLAKEFAQLTNNGAQFGMTLPEATEAVIAYADMLRASGSGRNIDVKQMAESAKIFNQELNLSAQVTGKSRKEMEKQIQEQMKRPDISAMLASMSPDIKKQFESTLTPMLQQLGQAGTDINNALIANIAVGPAAIDKKVLKAMQLSGTYGAFTDLSEAVRSGSMSQEEAQQRINEIGKTLENASTTQINAMKAVGGSNAEAAELVQKYTQDQRTAGVKREELENKISDLMKTGMTREAARQKISDDVAAANKSQMAAENAMNAATQTLSNMFKVLAVDVLEPMLPVIRFFAGTIEVLALGFKKLSDMFTYVFSLGGNIGVDKDKEGNVVGGAMKGAGTLAAAGTVGAGYMGYKYLKGLRSGGGAADIADKITDKGSKITETAEKIKGGKSGGILRSVSDGIASFGRPQVLLGVAAIAGLTATFYGFAKSIEVFNNIGWEGMGKAGVAMIAFGAAIGVLTLAAGPLAVAGPLVATGLTSMAVGVGALGLALLPVAASIGIVAAGAGVLADGLGAFGKGVGATFEGMGSMVGKATEGIGKGIGAVTDSFSNMRKTGIEATTDQIERLSQIPGDNMLASAKGIEAMKNALDGFQPGIMSGISNFFGSLFSSDPTAQLSKLAGLGDGLTKTVSGMNGFASAFDSVVNILNSRTLSSNAEKTFDQIKNMLGTDMGGMFGGSPKIIGQVSGLADSIAKLADSSAKLQDNTAAKSAVPTAGGISADILNKRTMQHYDDVRSANDSMINLLQGLNDKMDQLDRTTRDGTNSLSRSISKASPNLM